MTCVEVGGDTFNLTLWADLEVRTWIGFNQKIECVAHGHQEKPESQNSCAR